jgi:hypothetical protein
VSVPTGHPAGPGPVGQALDELLARHDGRAAGLWRRDGEALHLVAFRPAPDLADAVRAGFVAATNTVSLDATDLSVVRAAVEGRPVLAVAATLPPETGSGRWLRVFGASCSLAVPLPAADGRALGVLSVALRHVPDEAATADLAAAFGRLGVALLAGS